MGEEDPSDRLVMRQSRASVPALKALLDGVVAIGVLNDVFRDLNECVA